MKKGKSPREKASKKTASVKEETQLAFGDSSLDQDLMRRNKEWIESHTLDELLAYLDSQGL